MDDAGAARPAVARRGLRRLQLFHDAFVEAEAGRHFWSGSVAFDEHLAHAMHEVPLWVNCTPTVGDADRPRRSPVRNYIRKPGRPGGASSRSSRASTSSCCNKWYFDELYDSLFVRPAMWLGRLFWKRGDEGTIDRFGPHGAAYAVGVGNRITARLQSGYLYTYALVMLLGLIGAATWAIWWAR